MGDYSHLKNKKGEFIARPLPQPTLPNLRVDDDSSSMNTCVVAPSTYTQDPSYKGFTSEYPLMPAYNPYVAPHCNPSSATLCDDSIYPPPQTYDDDNESTLNFAAAAAPFARDPVDRHGSPYGPPQGGNYNPHDVYQGRTGPAQQQPQHRRSPPSSVGQPQGSLAYGDVPEYPGQYQHPVGMVAAPQSLDDPYGGYASPPAPISNQPPRRRNYDEESGYGRSQGGT